MLPSVNCIVAIDSDFGIGKNCSIPWNIKEDMNLFTHMTTTTTNPDLMNIVIMGKTTWLSINESYRPLKNRINIVISTTLSIDEEQYIGLTNLFMVKSMEEAFMVSYKMKNIENIFVMGGSRLYNECLKSGNIDNLYVTQIHKSYDCDSHININFLKFFNIFRKHTNLFDKSDKTIQHVTFTHYVNEKTYNELYKNETFDNYVLNHILYVNEEEDQYLNIMRKLLKGHHRQTRNAKTFSEFGKTMEFNLESFPLLTTKKMFLRGIFEELKFFLLGQTNTKILENKNVNIWKANTSHDFIKSLGLSYDEGDMGPMYGFQLRHHGAKYHGCNHNYENQGFDQFKHVIDTLITDKFSRRIMMTTYNPSQSDLGVLPPCHGITIQFGIKNHNMLCCHMYQRSGDWFLGVPFNIASYALLVYIIINIVNNNNSIDADKLVPGTLTMSFGDAHIYESHIETVKEQLNRKTSLRFPKLKINKILNISNLHEFEFSDLTVINYESYPALKTDMIA
jgi:dihydrofolate reductase/thymidylate synthase